MLRGELNTLDLEKVTVNRIMSGNIWVIHFLFNQLLKRHDRITLIGYINEMSTTGSVLELRGHRPKPIGQIC
jgi:hypothetical protein